MDELTPFEFGDKLPEALQDVGITVFNLEPYMAVLSLVTIEGKRVDMTIERASAGYILHALADFLAADPDELREKGN